MSLDKNKVSARKKLYYQENRIAILASEKVERENRSESDKLKDKLYQKVYSTQYRLNNADKIHKHNREYQLSHKLEKAVQGRQYALKIRIEILTHYGNGKLSCVRCGFSDIRALSIDHINGGGNEHRKVEGYFYTQLKKKGFPEGFQTLCMNCQFIKRDEKKECANGHKPHKILTLKAGEVNIGEIK